MKQHEVQQAVEFARAYLAKKACDVFALSAEARTLAKTVSVLNLAVEGGESGEERRLLDLLLGAADSLKVVEASRMLIEAVGRCHGEHR